MEGRLVLHFTTGAALLLLAVFATLYWAIHHYLDARMVPIFAAEFEDTADDLREAGGLRQVAEELTAPHSGPVSCWVRVFDNGDARTVETPGMAGKFPR